MYSIGPFTFHYNSNDPRIVYCESNFTLPASGLVLLTGPSGSGKTTFLNLLKGIIPEYIPGNLEGDILFNNNILTGEYYEKNITDIVYLFQNPYSQLIHQDSIGEFYFSLENFQVDIEEAKRKKNELSLKFDLEHIWGTKTSSLSHGECQKLLLASLLALSPKVLLLDEPTAFLDIHERNNFYEMLSGLKQDHLIIMIDHQLNEVFSKIDLLITVDENGKVKLNDKLEIPDFAQSNSLLLPIVKKSPQVSIEMRNLKYSYKGRPNLIDIPTFKMDAGEIIIIRGRNGTGKSTLLKLIAGFIPTKKDLINFSIEGKKISVNEIHKHIGFIFQDPESSFLFDTLQEELGGESFGFTNTELKRSPHQFSEGEKRRISIYIALAQNKKILLYDEPTFGQDYNNVIKLTEIILSLKKMNKLQIIISHDDAFIEKVCDKFLLPKDNIINVE